MVAKATEIILIYAGWTIIAIVLLLFALFSKTMGKPGETLVKSIYNPNVGRLTSFTDTNLNNWQFNIGNSGKLQYVWTANNAAPRVVWDSQNGSCGPNQANNTAMDADTNVQTRTEGITLAQTPMYLDSLGVQRTYRLQLYNADVRIESTNGDGKYWSIFGANNNKPSVWPSDIPDPYTVLWESTGANSTFNGIFFNNANLFVSQPNGLQLSFIASSWTNPVC